MIVIKRYRNRRLYHTGYKQFIVLTDLEEMVRRNEDFRVIESDGGKDITLSVLSSVISDRVKKHREKAEISDVLKAVIKIGGKESMSILKNTVLAGIGFVSLTKKKAEALVDQLIKTGELSKSEKKEAVMELLTKAETSAKETTAKVTSEIERGFKKFKVVNRDDLEALNKKVDSLTEMIERLEKRLDEK